MSIIGEGLSRVIKLDISMLLPFMRFISHTFHGGVEKFKMNKVSWITGRDCMLQTIVFF